ncbi:MAG: TonB-dependent receptor [Gemmatimonadaceae bacterium]|nr:TonB-dependent receptor [Gemmatimonadaceae bacterium]
MRTHLSSAASLPGRARAATARLPLVALAALAWAHPVQLPAQALSTLEGRVTSNTGSPLAGVALYLTSAVHATRGTTSDADGRFRFDSLAVGRYSLRARRVGYEAWNGDVDVKPSGTAAMEISLVIAPMNIEHVSIGPAWQALPRHHTVAQQPQGVTHAPDVAGGIVYAGTKNEVVQVAGMAANLAEKSARQIFARVPGVFVYDMDGTGNQVNISTRGLDAHRSWELNVRQDGVLLNSDLYGYPASHYSPPMEAIERLELTRGTAALQYGAQFGGLLNYVTKAPPPDRRAAFESINSAGSYGLRSTYNSLAGTVGDWSYTAYASGRWSDGYRTNGTSNADAEYLAVHYAPLGKYFSVKGRVGHSRYLYRIPGPLTDAQFAADPRQATRSRNYYSPNITVPSLVVAWGDSDWTRVTTTVSGVFGPRNSVQYLGFANQPDAPDASGAFAPRQVDIDNFQSVTTETRVTHTWWWHGRTQVLAAGIALSSNRMRRQQQGTGTRGDDYDLTITAAGFQRDVTYRTENGAVYVENLFRLNSRWDVIPGLRTEVGRTRLMGRLAYHDPADTPRQIDHQYPLLGLRTTYRGKAGIEWYGGWSQSYRPQILKDVLPNSALEYTDPALKDSRGWTAEAGGRGRWGSRLRYDVSAFEMRIGERFGTVRRTQGSANVLVRTNVGDSRTRGIELAGELVLWEGTGVALRVHTASSFYQARYTSGTVVASGTNRSIVGNRVESVPTVMSRSGIAFEQGRRSLQLLVSYVGESFADALNTRTPTADGAVGLVPAYTLTDVNAAFGVTRHARVRVGINNLLDRAYFTKRPQFYPGPGVWPSDGRGVQASLELFY